MSISKNFHVMGVQSCFFRCACVRHKINNKSGIFQQQKSNKIVEKYCGFSRSSAIKKI